VILVTGGTGFVGTALLPALTARGERVCVLTRRHIVAAPGVEVRTGDLLNPATLTAALRDVTAVIHLAAALPGPRVATTTLRRTNVEGTSNLATAAAAAGVERFVHVSSATVYGERADLEPADEDTRPIAETTYARSKLDAEHAVQIALRDTATSLVVLRPSEIHGPHREATVRFYAQICRRPVWVHAPVTVIVHPSYVGDVVSAILLTMSRPVATGTIFNIAGAEALTYTELIDRVAARLHVRIRQVRIPAHPTRDLARAATTVGRLLGRSFPRLARAQRQVVNRSIDIARARTVLGFEPYPLDAAIDATIAVARREGRL
jgi:dihydroflavonol-4-reductase